MIILILSYGATWVFASNADMRRVSSIGPEWLCTITHKNLSDTHNRWSKRYRTWEGPTIKFQKFEIRWIILYCQLLTFTGYPELWVLQAAMIYRLKQTDSEFFEFLNTCPKIHSIFHFFQNKNEKHNVWITTL